MESFYDRLMQDVRFREGLSACINCGTCTAICPGAEFYDYDPREIIDIVQTRDDKQIEDLLKSDKIWFCGECMSCVTRCPRGNAPGLVIMALRSLSQDIGLFVESEKGRQQLALKRTIGAWILEHGYCLYPPKISAENHPEQGPIWKWELQNLPEVMERMGANFEGEGPGVFRKIPQESLDEIYSIFEITGGIKRFDKIELFSRIKAQKLGISLDESLDNDYMKEIYG
ncbi:MAG: 4Fe-4S dicluster domain-containing protein [Bacteroidota bacterium]